MKVAVIGAGVSGLMTIKCCLDEGLEVVCFEKDSELGGLWRYEAGEKDGGSVYETTVMNSCKELIAFTDFPPPEDLPNFMHHTRIVQYFKLYVDNFALRQYIRFNTRILKCEPANDFDNTGRWKVTTQAKDAKPKSEIYDGVLVAIGHHGDPHIPLKDFPGIKEHFDGHYIHTHSYRNDASYGGKNVVVIGTGNSGCDLAVELSRCADQTFLSTRRGVWVFNRMMDYGVPFDISVITRYNMMMKLKLPSIVNNQFETYLTSRFDHERYGLKPKHRVLSQHPTINDELPNRILNGTVKVKSNVARFEKDTAVFSDGTREKVDEVIFATGFNYSFPFLNENIVKVVKNESQLYMLMWPMNLKRNTLAVIGLHQPFHSINNVSEMQARWAARVLAGKMKLPTNSDMKQHFANMKTNMKKQFIASQRHTIEVDGIDYMDEISDMIGCKPQYFKMMLTDPLLAYKIYFGPCTGYQYRLQGPGAWKGARDAILTQDKRMECPTRTRDCGTDESRTSFLLYAFLIAMFAVLIYCMYMR